MFERDPLTLHIRIHYELYVREYLLSIYHTFFLHVRFVTKHVVSWSLNVDLALARPAIQEFSDDN